MKGNEIREAFCRARKGQICNVSFVVEPQQLQLESDAIVRCRPITEAGSQ